MIYETRIRELESSLKALLDTTPFRLGDLVKRGDGSACVPGVYVISEPEGGRIVYVGCTKWKQIRDRMIDHRRGTGSSDLCKMLACSPDQVEMLDRYMIRWLQIEDRKQRSRLEHFAIAVLDPFLNDACKSGSPGILERKEQGEYIPDEDARP
jgi:hypothetical protein